MKITREILKNMIKEEAEKDNDVFHRDVLDIHNDGRGAIVSEDFW